MATPVDTQFMVAGIDLGTTYSSHAFSFKSDPLPIHAHVWSAGNELSHKTSSVILLNPDKSFNSFGFNAEKKFTDMAEDMRPEELEAYYYITPSKWHFIKKRYENDNGEVRSGIRRNMEVYDIFGKPIRLTYIIEKSIWYLKDHLLESLNHRGFQTTVMDVRWVITVPAVWTDQAKLMMRECAHEAGIPDNALSLAYEPEVAALFCKQIPGDQITGTNENVFREGTEFMVVDLGGGTTDVTVQRMFGDKMASVFAVSGGPWGGAKVNAEYINFLIEIFGNEVIRRLKRHDIGGFLELISEFEVKKRNTDSIQQKRDITIRLPSELRKIYENFNESCFENAFTEHSNDVALRIDKMRIKFRKFESFFSNTISKIIEHLKSLIEEKDIHVPTILMVGGFSECRLVSDAITTAFPNHNVIIPMECDLSVLKGAVLYGHRPQSITARYCHYSIGISLNKPYDPTEHVGAVTFKSGKTTKCGKCFETLFRKGRIVEVGEKATIEVHSDHRESDREMWKYDVKECEIFTSNKTYPKFVTEAGCNRHAIVTIRPPDGGWPEVVDGKIEMEVGGTEVIVRYIDETTQRTTTVKLDSLTCLGE